MKIKNLYFCGMKIICLLLSFYVFLLVGAPFLTFFQSAETTNEECHQPCCSANSGCNNEKNRDAKKDDTKSDNCCKALCNPFMNCCNCHALTPQMSSFSVPISYTEWQYCCFQPSIREGYCSDCWQPPSRS